MKKNMLDQIKAAYERDMQSGRVAVLESELPLSFETITDEWLTNVLCKAHAGARVVAHRLSEVNNGSSNRRKIYLEYNAEGKAAGLPEAVFCKATHGLENRILLGMGGGARCEVLFYRDIRPHLNIEAPRCFYANMDHESFNSMIMLNDLTDEVTEFCTDKTPMSRARAESQMRLLAEFHGRCYASPQLQELLQQYMTWSDNFRNTETFGMKEGSSAGFLAAESVIPARLYRRFDEIWPATLASLAIHEQEPHTLAHGDVHLKNWYVAGSGEMGLSDWQCCGRGHWGRDLAYTISSALTPEDRRAWERELVQLYLTQLHASGGPEVSFDEGWTIYRQQLMTALTWWTVTLTPPPGLPDMQPRDTTLEFIRRIATAIDDLDSLDAFK
jgi:thiamine kinase-like enzyme